MTCPECGRMMERRYVSNEHLTIQFVCPVHGVVKTLEFKDVVLGEFTDKCPRCGFPMDEILYGSLKPPIFLDERVVCPVCGLKIVYHPVDLSTRVETESTDYIFTEMEHHSGAYMATERGVIVIALNRIMSFESLLNTIEHETLHHVIKKMRDDGRKFYDPFEEQVICWMLSLKSVETSSSGGD